MAFHSITRYDGIALACATVSFKHVEEQRQLNRDSSAV